MPFPDLEKEHITSALIIVLSGLSGLFFSFMIAQLHVPTTSKSLYCFCISKTLFNEVG